MDSNFRDVFIITAPSGTGKTTLNRRLVKEIPELEISISLTTRPQRDGEVDGDHYWFVDKDKFFEYVNNGKMLEWAQVFGNYYGTSLDEINRIAGQGKKTLLEIDVQGWKQANEKIPGATSVFILPPSIKDLWERLDKRGTDPLAVRWRRINTARAELDHCSDYQHFIVNDNLEEAFQELKRVVTHQNTQRMSRSQGIEHSRRLIAEFDNAEWLQKIKEEVLQN